MAAFQSHMHMKCYFKKKKKIRIILTVVKLF